MCYLPGLEPRRWPCMYRGSEGARYWWGWWVLTVGGAVVELGEVGSGGVATATAAAGPVLIVAALWHSKTAKRGLERALVKGSKVHA